LRRYGELLWKAPELAAADDGRVIIEKHARGVAAVAALEGVRAGSTQAAAGLRCKHFF
jgi:hypothetical protein